MGTRGPVFFRQERISKNKKRFTILKFRTMYYDPLNDPKILTRENDPRITPFGRVLRRYKLDELPQLWNIVNGTMNWFGPRPEQPFYVEKLIESDPSFEMLYSVKAGLLSLGGIRHGYARNVESMVRRARYDLYYLEHRSWRMHLYLFLKSLVYAIGKRENPEV